MTNRYYLYQPDTGRKDIYFLMDERKQRTRELWGRAYVSTALNYLIIPGAASGWLVGSMPYTQLHMYLSLNPNLTIKDLADILRNKHEMPLL